MNDDWKSLSEEGHYAIWSGYVGFGGRLDYVAFCDYMDRLQN